MTDREALYLGILADPDDNTLRLIYADAVEDEGDTRRAAFIRTQVQLAHLPEYDPAHIRARHERTELYDPEWLLALELPAGLDWSREAIRRGFPAAIQARDAAAFVEHADELFARFPIESVELAVARLGEVHTFAHCEWVSRLTRLAVGEGLGGQSARGLLNSPHYHRLRELHIGAGLTTAVTAAAIVGSRAFKQLVTLSYRDGRTARALVTELSQLADPPRLKSLDLSGNRLLADQLTRLLAAPALSAVEELDLSEDLGVGAVPAIAAAKLPHLRSLRLLRTRPGEDGVRALAEADFLPELRSLTLGGSNLPPSAAAVLARTPAVANLSVLDLRENRLGDVGAELLANSPHLRMLAELDLAENFIEDDGANTLVESPNLERLIHLNLSGNLITPAAQTRLRRRFGDRVSF